MQDCSNSIANALGSLQYCTKPSILLLDMGLKDGLRDRGPCSSLAGSSQGKDTAYTLYLSWLAVTMTSDKENSGQRHTICSLSNVMYLRFSCDWRIAILFTTLQIHMKKIAHIHHYCYTGSDEALWVHQCKWSIHVEKDYNGWCMLVFHLLYNF